MSIEVTLTLPESLIENARKFGQATRRDAEVVLADALERLLQKPSLKQSNGACVSQLRLELC
jgi:hypothetical protein